MSKTRRGILCMSLYRNCPLLIQGFKDEFHLFISAGTECEIVCEIFLCFSLVYIHVVDAAELVTGNVKALAFFTVCRICV